MAKHYEQVFCCNFELDESYGFWVGDEIGGTYCNGDTICVTFDEMRIIVENKMSKDDFLEYEEYVSFCMDFDRVAPNLRAWIKGCPRYTKESMQNLRDLKKEFDIANANLYQAKNKL